MIQIQGKHRPIDYWTKEEIAQKAFDLYQSHGLPSDIFLDEFEKYYKTEDICLKIVTTEVYKKLEKVIEYLDKGGGKSESIDKTRRNYPDRR